MKIYYRQYNPEDQGGIVVDIVNNQGKGLNIYMHESGHFSIFPFVNLPVNKLGVTVIDPVEHTLERFIKGE